MTDPHNLDRDDDISQPPQFVGWRIGLAWLVTIAIPTILTWWGLYLPLADISPDSHTALAYSVSSALTTFFTAIVAGAAAVCCFLFCVILIPRNLTDVVHLVGAGVLLGLPLSVFASELAGPWLPPAGGGFMGLIFWTVAFSGRRR